MLSQDEWEKINSIIASIHKCTPNFQLRAEFLQKLMQIIDFNFADFNIGLIKKNSYPYLVDPVVVSKFDKKFEEDFMVQYESIYAPMDYVNWVFLSPESLVYRESDLINENIRKKSPFYTKYLKPFNLVNIAGIVIATEGKFLGAVTLYKSEEKGDFTDKDIYILNQLLPHLQLKFNSNSENGNPSIKNSSYMLKQNFMITNREIEVIGVVCKGFSNSEIAKELCIAPNTVKKHIYNIFEKLSISSRTQLIKFLVSHELLNVFSGDK